MKIVTLPSGESVPALGMGTWMLGETPSCRAQEISTLQRGIDLGMSLIDTAIQAGIGCVVGTIAYLAYFVYDLAALQTRRRLGQELGGVMDLYRDVLNFTTYPIRVVQHWRRHRFWSVKT